MSGGEASHFRGRSSLYKPAKAGCPGHSLPTVTSSPARRHSLRAPPVLRTKTGWGDTGGPRAGSPAAHIQVLVPWSWFTQESRAFPTAER